ncbi:MAG: hypothetical protein IPN65_03910 [Elusimicrobia bacterium]|jgi:hypothetical protein|nr:hypothetical protein [Elusimicrobiota bacterium]MBK7546186.1 hypothetical protein [Elusimicrobiota bacterium]MBK7575769.1 hypothetical protein [Elusimicrobiota bacterium]MBK8127311.1 hypothetical protein [Elusimicrobiota bacterium]MBK8424390.1 hypothetical protein [Elusimicrobiota bacterium]
MEVSAPYDGGLEGELSSLPDLVADALAVWKKAEADKRREAARLYLMFKAKLAGRETTATELRAMVDNDEGYYIMCLDCVTAESAHVRLYEKLMAAKRAASMRAAF